ncbi:hypothetical protein G7Y89_g1509 [Cudoniella acicularis]|uniref:Pentatricopeptide repeat-containing protein-mitochondrial domain-containing protein n=1 Tax=Cudoniella acicularis TaxID=354080 RepID=A0A8H4RW91_9HELO|nr:hypothetical protein G7Y89_g1509 [Cudoniella acicularis]
MQPIRITIDGLWRCLCPSVDSIAVSYRATHFLPIRKTAIRSHTANKTTRHLRTRAFHTSAQTRQEEVGTEQPFLDDEFKLSHRRVPQVVVRRIQPSNSFDNISTPHLYDELRQIRTQQGAYDSVSELVDYLINIRGEKPALIHYDALIRANCDAEKGSAAVVKGLLREMEEDGIGADAALYHAVLQVLAIHPDYLLRNKIMQDMKERWFGLSPEGWHFLITGLLRDREYEVAMDKLEQMQNDGIRIQPWLYDIFTYKLCEAKELDAAFELLCFRWERDRKEIEPSIWYYLLDAFTSAFHYEGAKYIWKLRVSTSYLNPSDGICSNVLNLAARYADPGLATSAIRILSSRRTALSPFHYEALLGAYVATDDLNTAFRIIGVIDKAGYEPDSGTTRPIFVHLSTSRSLPGKAWKVLKNQFEEGHKIHVAAANVVIEAAITTEQFQEAVNFYMDLHNICKSGPNTETFNILLQGAEKRADCKAQAMFLASEMMALSIKPDHLTYDRLIMVCLHEEDYEDAFKYLEEMIHVGKDKIENGKKGWWMRRGTAGEMARRCADSGDERGRHIIAEMERRGLANPNQNRWHNKLKDKVNEKVARANSMTGHNLPQAASKGG